MIDKIIKIIQEFIQALDEEIEAIKKGKGGSVVKVFNGRFLREVSGLYVYIFNLENFLAVLDDSPAEIEIHGVRYPAQVISTQGMEVEIGIERFCDKLIQEAKLHTKLWYLLEILKKKYTGVQSSSSKNNFQLSDILFSNDESKYRKNEKVRIQYSVSDKPLNISQGKAVESSVTSQVSIMWGPPGTGKTKTIASAVEAHLNAGRRILLVSHANNAVDEALEDVAEHLKDTPFYNEGKLVRLGISQPEHLSKLEEEFEMVLLDKIAQRLGESLVNEKNSLESEKSRLDRILDELGEAFRNMEIVKRISSEINDLDGSIFESNEKLNRCKRELYQSNETQRINTERLQEAEEAGVLKKIFKNLNPEKIQREIDKTTIAIDTKKRLINEIEIRLNQLHQSRSNKENEANNAKGSLEKLLKRLGLTSVELEKDKKKSEEQRDKILSRISEITRQLDEIQKNILSEAKLVATTLTKTFVAKQFPDAPFDVLIVDEASMAPLPHLYWAASRCRQSITIVGDFLQLPPICISDKAMAQKWLGRSIFTVLGVDSVMVACKDSRVTLLDEQYRMAPEISLIPNRLFYDRLLKDHPTTSNRKLDDGVSDSPLVLIDTAAMNPWCSRLSTGGRFNLYNALVSATLARRIITNDSDLRIGIVTPYAAQARLINKIAKDWEIWDRVRISTVHRFQGGQEPVIILDTCEGPGEKIAPMLDDTKKDSDAQLVLNVAITRSQNRFYIVGHTKYLLSELHRDSALARIIHHFNENAEIIPSENLVDNYLTTDFEKWAEALLPTASSREKPVSGKLFTEKNFWAQFFLDLRATQKKLVILSPFISTRRTSHLMEYFHAMVNRGIEIHIHTRPINQQVGEMVNQAEVVIDQLRKIGAKVIERRSMHQKVAIVDNAIAWEGSLNILSHKDSGEHMRRFEERSAIEEIRKNLELDEEMVVGLESDETCPLCDGKLIVRTKYGRKFWGCSNYAKMKCKYTLSMDGQYKKRRT